MKINPRQNEMYQRWQDAADRVAELEAELVELETESVLYRRENSRLLAGLNKVKSLRRNCYASLGGRPSDAQSVTRLVIEACDDALQTAGLEE